MFTPPCVSFSNVSPAAISIWRLSVSQYHEMIDNGILSPDDKVELLEGVLVEKMSKKPAHSISTYLARRALEKVIPEGWYVSIQEPITLSASEPEPDVAVIRGQARDYQECHPGPLHVLLVVEIADTSLDRDRIVKKAIYARAGIPVYWVVDLNARRVEVFSRPEGGDYGKCLTFRENDSVPVMLDGRLAGHVAVSELLP